LNQPIELFKHCTAQFQPQNDAQCEKNCCSVDRLKKNLPFFSQSAPISAAVKDTEFDSWLMKTDAAVAASVTRN